MKSINLEDNISKLKNVYKMSDGLINKILYSNETTTYSNHPIEISSFLTHVDNIDDTVRIISIIEGLHRNIGISYETLAVYGGIDTFEFEEFLHSPASLKIEKKFILAVRIMYLHFVLKEKYKIETISD
ncbi:hypothetical protein AN964_01795 [Heyndrickxia shackletonii]|uniref:Uncharacterized protein n=1 Tax=Heyndrickxia shackletonii TaxID=157838 RepID=A0A0Q3TE70_9BACI|nr:HTH domain-containing protein [Heyndrickxia shackletonii]KQL52400.1 hypothetical protein AN964_01795 [Heyndrickxia shackletonii]NEY99042.1 hypothetical protein [Heyndrickxia shackletonii]